MRRARFLFLAMVACLAVASPVAAGKPIMERVPINDIGVLDEFLTDACGFDVLVDARGHITFRLFTDASGAPLREVNNFAIRLRYYSAWGSVRTVDVGVDRITYNADGSITQVITGNVQSLQIPGQGRVYSDVGQTTLLITFPDPEGEPVVEVVRQAGQHSDTDSSAILCEALAP